MVVDEQTNVDCVRQGLVPYMAHIGGKEEKSRFDI
jgi:hypothetical protein